MAKEKSIDSLTSTRDDIVIMRGIRENHILSERRYVSSLKKKVIKATALTIIMNFVCYGIFYFGIFYLLSVVR